MLVYLGLQKMDIGYLFVSLAAVSVVKLIVSWKQKPQNILNRFSPLALIALAGISFASNEKRFFLFYPLVINGALFFIFASSLFREKTIIETIARLREPNLPIQAVAYTRWVTKVWSAFFILNSIVVAYSIFYASMEFWTLYNGLIGYIVIGVLFAGEFLVRSILKKKWEAQNA